MNTGGQALEFIVNEQRNDDIHYHACKFRPKRSIISKNLNCDYGLTIIKPPTGFDRDNADPCHKLCSFPSMASQIILDPALRERMHNIIKYQSIFKSRITYSLHVRYLHLAYLAIT